MGLVERANQTIQTILSKMPFTRRHWDLFLPFAQYSYNIMPRAMLKGLCFFEIIYGYLPGDNPFDQLASSIPQLLGDEIIEYAERKREILEAIRHDQRWYQQMTSGIADNVPIGTWVFVDMYPKSKPPQAKPRFHGPFIIVKKLDKGAVIVRLQDGSEEIVNLDRCHTFKGHPMIEWTKDFVQSEKKDMGKSTALVPATRTQVTDEESQVFQIGSVAEEPQVVRMEKEESEISLFPDTLTQDTEPPTNQEDFFVWIKNLDSHMENREQFLRGLRNPFGLRSRKRSRR